MLIKKKIQPLIYFEIKIFEIYYSFQCLDKNNIISVFKLLLEASKVIFKSFIIRVSEHLQLRIFKAVTGYNLITTVHKQQLN